jgi:hypothetical protein
MELAKSLGQPEGTAIYFTVDYDAQNRDFSSILTYFMMVKSTLKGYKLGAYGSYSVLNYLYSQKIADYYFQTYAWSGGLRCKFNHIYQYQNGKTLAGVEVDFDNLEQKEIGAWGQALVKDNTKWRLRSGTFDSAAELAKAVEIMKGKGWLVHEKAESLELNPQYRFITGTTDKAHADAMALDLKNKYGWLLYVEQE